MVVLKARTHSWDVETPTVVKRKLKIEFKDTKKCTIRTIVGRLRIH